MGNEVTVSDSGLSGLINNEMGTIKADLEKLKKVFYLHSHFCLFDFFHAATWCWQSELRKDALISRRKRI